MISEPDAAGGADVPTAYSPVSVPPDAPGWFRDALGRAFETVEIEVAGAPVRYLSWGDPHEPTTVFVHGGAAHAMWWTPLAAQWGGHAVALDLSGHGISGHRSAYSVSGWVEEIRAVIEHASSGPATLIGHSLGGILSSYVAVRHGELLERALFVDAPVWPGSPAPEGALASKAGRPQRLYPTVADALARFRLVPPQPCTNQWYIDHIAWHSLTRQEGGWRWRFDPQVFADPVDDHRLVRFEGSLAEARCPYGLVMGGSSYLAASAAEVLGPEPAFPYRVVPGAGHHVMLDQPLALLETLDGLVRDWR